jgi:gliding-associated putative ABC transporter substrate-binding component GldG
MINVREKDQMKQQKAYLGAVFELGNNKDAIPFIQPGAPLEYALSTAIKKISATDKPHVAFIQGQGEPPLYEMGQVNTALSILYNVEPYIISADQAIPERFKTVAIVAPADSFDEGVLQRLDEYLEKGGNILVALNRVSGNFQTLFGAEINTGLEKWLEQKGITVDNSFIIDTKCGMVALQQQQGFFNFTTNINFPFLPVISHFADHPAVKGIEGVLLTFASPVIFTGDNTKGTFTPLAFTSERSGNLKAPQVFNVQRQWTNADFPLKKQVVAGVLEINQPGGMTSKLFVIGDGDFAVNGPRERMMQLQPDNVNFMVNAIDWLSDKTGLIELRTKGIQFRPLKEMEDGKKAFLKYLNFLLPMGVVIIYGIIRSQINQNKRIKRMEENFD